MADRGLILACTGCCCGHAERGGPKTAPGALKREMRRAFRWTGGGEGPDPPITDT